MWFSVNFKEDSPDCILLGKGLKGEPVVPSVPCNPVFYDADLWRMPGQRLPLAFTMASNLRGV